jgi:hypothetical protein
VAVAVTPSIDPEMKALFKNMIPAWKNYSTNYILVNDEDVLKTDFGAVLQKVEAKPQVTETDQQEFEKTYGVLKTLLDTHINADIENAFVFKHPDSPVNTPTLRETLDKLKSENKDYTKTSMIRQTITDINCSVKDKNENLDTVFFYRGPRMGNGFLGSLFSSALEADKLYSNSDGIGWTLDINRDLIFSPNQTTLLDAEFEIAGQKKVQFQENFVNSK